MIKVILIGGGDLNSPVLECIKNESVLGIQSSKKIKAMVIPFARYEEDWEIVYNKNILKYSHPDYEYDFICSSKNKEEFLVQLQNIELLIIPGGSELDLIKNLPPLTGLNFDNKLIIATSAGVNFLSSLYYSNDRNEFTAGSGILKINTICHFKSDSLDKIKFLTESNDRPTFALKEGEFITLYEKA